MISITTAGFGDGSNYFLNGCQVDNARSYISFRLTLKSLIYLMETGVHIRVLMVSGVFYSLTPLYCNVTPCLRFTSVYDTIRRCSSGVNRAG